ncbi:sulfurtransferase [Nonomuraea sp. NPDC050310]|uniref:sulfurtransferase n=1 Tax=Nonomuraea sp. NPDC050310 TaxID=3154935 RepID=UPI003407A364
MSPLITLAELDALGEVTLLDVRSRLGGPPGVTFYREGHIPGAAYCDLDADLAGPAGAGGRHPLPETEAFQAAMRRLGVSNDRPVVAYDDAGSTIAARIWWTLRYFGHQDVRVLDGGLAAWTADGRPATTDEPQVEPGDFVAKPGALPVLDADEAAALARSGILVDARSAERYRGETEPIDPAAGHVPGAVNVPTTGNVGPDGRFLPAEQLRARFDAVGVRDGVPLGAYCGSGVTAAHELIALELAGYPGAALYVGSWSNWSADPSRPIETA